MAAENVLQCSMTQTTAEPVTTEKPEPIQTTEQTGFNSLVGINEAARLTRRSKGQISQDTKSGRLSYELNERQQKQYQVAELARVYGLKTGEQEGSENRDEPDEEPAKTAAVEVLLLKQQLETLKQEVSSLREDKERLWKQNEQLTGRLLAAPTPPAESTLPAAAPKSFWQRMFNP